MNIKLLIKRVIQGITIIVLTLVTGCAVPVSAEAPTMMPEELPSPTEYVQPPEEQVLTATPAEPTRLTVTPTEAPTPSPSPTPAELPVYEQILRLESSEAPDPEIPVKAALLVNMTENKVLYAENAAKTIYPASITKLMTALVALESEADLTETVEISKTAATPVIASAKMCGFSAGDRILLKDLLGCMLVYSGNDTSVAVAEHIAGSEEEFVAMMNRKAAELGLISSVFCNSHGLPDDNHVTSAYDIYLIMQKLFNFEEFLGIIDLGSINVDVLRGNSLKTFTFTSTNQFLSGLHKLPEGITLLGGKTGTTNKAGCCLTLYVKDQNSNCYIAEIFGAESYETLYPCMIQLLSHISEE